MSKWIGIEYDGDSKKFMVKLGVKSLGSYKSYEDAASAYDAEAERVFGVAAIKAPKKLTTKGKK